MVPEPVKLAIADLASGKRAAHGPAYETLLAATTDEVTWGGEAWDELVPLLSHKDNRVRSIVGQTLCNLAQSAERTQVDRDFEAVLAVTRDERFVTARHVLGASWKLGLANADVRKRLVDWYAKRFSTSEGEKHGTLIRYDILCAMRRLFEATDDAAIKSQAAALIASEQDGKYRKKYADSWRDLLT